MPGPDTTVRTDVIEIAYRLTQPVLFDAMVAAGRVLLGRRRTVRLGLVQLAVVVLSMAGGFAVGVALSRLWPDAPGGVLVAAATLGAGGAGLVALNMPVSLVSRATLGSRMGRSEQRLRFDAESVTFLVAGAVWRTDWALVEGLIETRIAFGVVVSGITLAAPKDAMRPGDADRIRAWFDAARAAEAERLP